jgi:Zn-dependent M16 (insulinase) family peptidase
MRIRLREGERYSGFEVLSARKLAEYESVAVHLKHRITGCELFHLRLFQKSRAANNFH